MKSSNLPPFPQGWYCLRPSRELKPGDVVPVTFCGDEYVLFRTESGHALAFSAFCPHLGAHLGHGGTVRGERIECPFHAFQFDTDGACVKTGYGTPPPERCRLQQLATRERDGLILAWHDPLGRPPTWEVPALDEGSWKPPLFSTVELASHPQETSENSVDLGHLSIVHGYGEVTETEPVEIRKQTLTTRYQMRRKNPFGVGPSHVLVNFEANVYGLGVSVVSIHVEPFGFQLRLFILPTPTSAGRIVLRAGVTMQRWAPLSVLPSVGRLRPADWVETLIQILTLRGVAYDVSQDFAIWEAKTYLAEPVLARGDGPIGRYRLWCRQFYPRPGGEAHEHPRQSASVSE